jgi:hypothetical protein
MPSLHPALSGKMWNKNTGRDVVAASSMVCLCLVPLEIFLNFLKML